MPQVVRVPYQGPRSYARAPNAPTPKPIPPAPPACRARHAVPRPGRPGAAMRPPRPLRAHAAAPARPASGGNLHIMGHPAFLPVRQVPVRQAAVVRTRTRRPSLLRSFGSFALLLSMSFAAHGLYYLA